MQMFNVHMYMYVYKKILSAQCQRIPTPDVCTYLENAYTRVSDVREVTKDYSIEKQLINLEVVREIHNIYNHSYMYASLSYHIIYLCTCMCIRNACQFTIIYIMPLISVCYVLYMYLGNS